jgi:hypothetical protein
MRIISRMIDNKDGDAYNDNNDVEDNDCEYDE